MTQHNRYMKTLDYVIFRGPWGARSFDRFDFYMIVKGRSEIMAETGISDSAITKSLRYNTPIADFNTGHYSYWIKRA